MENNGVTIIGTSVDSIDVAEDRKRFSDVAKELGLAQPPHGTAYDLQGALALAPGIGYPMLLRPSFVLGGRAMEIVFDADGLSKYISRAAEASPGKPVLFDRFLENATEVDVDCLSDGTRTVIGGVMQHIEQAGIHSGDSACVIPPYSLPADVIEIIKEQSKRLAAKLQVRGLMNIQFAVTGLGTGSKEAPKVYILEANPRASRTVPFVSKATGVQLARLASLVMVGKTLDELGATEVVPTHVSIKESVFPFSKFPGAQVQLGPEMKSTGEVMGIDRDLPMAFAKSQMAASALLPVKGTIFVSVASADKEAVGPVARQFTDMGYKLLATSGTGGYLQSLGVPVEVIPKIQEGRPNLLDKMKNGEVAMIINTPSGRGSKTDEGTIRTEAVKHRVTLITTVAAAGAAADACRALREREMTVTALQDWFPAQK